MFGSEILEVAIGLAVVFLLGGLLCSALNELVLGVLRNVRANDLWKGLRRVVRDERLAERIRDHPLVEGLRTGPKRQLTYLPSWTFVDTLLTLVLSRPGTDTTEAVTNVTGIKPMQPGAASAAPAGAQADAGPALTLDEDLLQRLRHAIQRRLKDRSASATTAPRGSDDALPLPTAEALEALLLTCRDLPEARARLEQWFDDAMERVSGEYKRKAQRWLVVWAVLVVFGGNIDSIRIAEHLYQNPGLRRALADSAGGVVEESRELLATNAVAQATNAPAGSIEQLREAANRVAAVSRQLEDLGLPIGWSNARPHLRGHLFETAMGLLLSTAAFAMGAPFWFDLLNKLVNLRAGGRPPPTTAQTPPGVPAANLTVSASARTGTHMGGSAAAPPDRSP
jgi:hypothetical protein